MFLADEAQRIGVVTRLADEPLEEALALAEEIVGRSPDSVACAKELLQTTWHATEDECLNTETALQRKLLGELEPVCCISKGIWRVVRTIQKRS